jgi:hypothetical protein
MPVSAEQLLVGALFGFYLKDCLLLLDADEALLERRGRGAWCVRFGPADYTLGGRQPVLCPPLAPHRPVHRLRWSMTKAGPPQADAGWNGDEPPALLGWRLRLGVGLVAACVLGLVPAVLLGGFGTMALLAGVGLAYASVVALLAAVFVERAALSLDTRAFWSLAGEVLLCAPYAINVLRRVSLRASPRADLVDTAQRLLDDAGRETLRRECAARIQRQWESEPEGSARAAALRAAQRALAPADEGPSRDAA